MNESVKNYRQKVDRRLKIRQRIFFVIIPILLAIDIKNVLNDKLSAVLALIGFIFATLIGLLLSRMFKIFWHQEKEKVMSQLDTIGIILLVIYMGIEFFRNWIFGHWLTGPTLTAFGLIILTGLLLGRFLGTLIKINKILIQNKNKI